MEKNENKNVKDEYLGVLGEPYRFKLFGKRYRVTAKGMYLIEDITDVFVRLLWMSMYVTVPMIIFIIWALNNGYHW